MQHKCQFRDSICNGFIVYFDRGIRVHPNALVDITKLKKVDIKLNSNYSNKIKQLFHRSDLVLIIAKCPE